MTTPFHLQLVSEGATGLDVFPPDAEDPNYSFRYVPPAGPSIRNSIRSRIPPRALDDFVRDIDGIFSRIAGRGARQAGGITCDDNDIRLLEDCGSQLWTLALPRDIQEGLAKGRHIIELGLDGTQLHHPWELLHDGDNFICLKHSIARHINLETGADAQPVPGRFVDRALGKVSVLVISVARPSHGGLTDLPEVTAETEEIIQCLGDKAQIDLTVLRNEDASRDRVRWAAAQGYDIVHFSGHGLVDGNSNHSLALQDEPLPAADLAAFFKRTPPILFFLNACHTSGTHDMGGRARRWLHGSSFARAVLENGSYLLGSRWPLADGGAAVFASSFYRAFLWQLIGSASATPWLDVEGVPQGRNAYLGEAITIARAECARSTSLRRDLAWGSYVFYGDPRLAFVMTPWGRRAERDRIMLSLAEKIIETTGRGA